MKRFIDLSHTIEDGMLTYKGLPGPIICDYLSRKQSRSVYAPGYEFQIGKIEMVSNTGTYVDVPFHRFADGKDLSETHIEKFAELPGIVVRANHRDGIRIDKDRFEGLSLKGKAVLIHTDWCEHWRTEKYFREHPFLTEEAAIYLSDQGVALVGIDSHNLDDTRTNARPAHTVLLRHEIVIAEHLCNLHLLPDSGFTFSAVPPKFKSVGTFPVRAYATIALKEENQLTSLII